MLASALEAAHVPTLPKHSAAAPDGCTASRVMPGEAEVPRLDNAEGACAEPHRHVRRGRRHGEGARKRARLLALQAGLLEEELLAALLEELLAAAALDAARTVGNVKARHFPASTSLPKS